jgi:integrase
MGSIYKKRDTYYIRFKDQRGKWVARAAAANKKDAERILKDVERGVRRLGSTAPVSDQSAAEGSRLRDLTADWLKRRRNRGLRNVDNDKGHLDNHILPALGDMGANEIRPRHVVAFISALRQTKLAPRTIRKIYGSLHKLFSDLVRDEVLQYSPCVLTNNDLPKNRDKDPTWRARAVFTREELELLISSDAIPPDRRVLYALLYLTGMRIGEAAGVRWGDLDKAAKPLQRLIVAYSYENLTKTEKPREVPVHPTLATILAEWKLSGWPALMGRKPSSSDLIIPSRKGVMRSNNQARNKFYDDLARLGLRKRRPHDSRRTFISLARVDGARVDHLEYVTHAKRGDIMNLYTTLPWATLCEAVACLKVKRLAGDTFALPVSADDDDDEGAEGEGDRGSDFVTELVTQRKSRSRFVQKSWKRQNKARPAAGGGGGNRMGPGAYVGPLHPEKPEEIAGAKTGEDGSRQVWGQGFVTQVTRLQGLLRAAREALVAGEGGRADRVIGEAQRVLSRFDAGSPPESVSGRDSVLAAPAGSA